MFSEINGLPLHPLMVHAVVVLIPLATLGAVLVAVRPSWSRAYAPLVCALALIGAASAWVAEQAGEALQEELGFTGDRLTQIEAHAEWGERTFLLGAFFAVASVATLVLARMLGAGSRWPRVAAAVTAVIGVVATVFTVLAGDSGAESVWGYVFGS